MVGRRGAGGNTYGADPVQPGFLDLPGIVDAVSRHALLIRHPTSAMVFDEVSEPTTRIRSHRCASSRTASCRLVVA